MTAFKSLKRILQKICFIFIKLRKPVAYFVFRTYQFYESNLCLMAVSDFDVSELLLKKYFIPLRTVKSPCSSSEFQVNIFLLKRSTVFFIVRFFSHSSQADSKDGFIFSPGSAHNSSL